MAKVTVTFSGELVGEYPLDRPASIVGSASPAPTASSSSAGTTTSSRT